MEYKFYRDPVSGKVVPERRSGIDRRRPSEFFAIFISPFRRRKSKGRRKTDRGAYVDIYDSRSWAIAIAVLILSFLDALLTGFHITNGSARELNPVMKAVINYGGWPGFYGVKAVMTIFPVAIILIHKEWALGKFAARLCLWAYMLLFVYHICLIVIGRAFVI
jgi:hypothetical protein